MRKESVMSKIVNQLEWSQIIYSEAAESSIFCCLLCGGVKPDTYEKHNEEFQDDTRYYKGHFEDCLYLKVGDNH